MALANQDTELVSYMSWNTLSVKVQAERVTVWLNGEEIGSVRMHGASKGGIGLFLADTGGAKAGELTIGEILIQTLGK